MNKKAIVIIVAILAIAGIAYLVMHTSKKNTNTENRTENAAMGRVVFAISDAAMDMGAISKINMTISSVDVHDQTNGWVTVSGAAQTYDLLDLKAKNESKLLVDFKAPVGSYDMVRLMVDKVLVV